MAKVGVKLGYTKKIGDFDFIRADIIIEEMEEASASEHSEALKNHLKNILERIRKLNC